MLCKLLRLSAELTHDCEIATWLNNCLTLIFSWVGLFFTYEYTGQGCTNLWIVASDLVENFELKIAIFKRNDYSNFFSTLVIFNIK